MTEDEMMEFLWGHIKEHTEWSDRATIMSNPPKVSDYCEIDGSLDLRDLARAILAKVKCP